MVRSRRSEANDPSAMTVWGLFKHPETNARAHSHGWMAAAFSVCTAILRLGWTDEIPHAGDTEAIVRRRNAKYRQRVGNQWGLVEHVSATCQKFDVDVC